MHQRLAMSVLAALVVSVLGAPVPARAADPYVVDAMHSSVYFKISHLGLSSVYGRFNSFTGSFTIDPSDAANCAFAMTIRTESIDTNNRKRDDHLRSPDFFNVKQFPAITFKATAVKPIQDGYEVTGDFTMHGVTKSIRFPLLGGRKAEFPKGVERTGFSTELTLKRSDFGMTKFAEALGDDVLVAISFEGTKK